MQLLQTVPPYTQLMPITGTLSPASGAVLIARLTGADTQDQQTLSQLRRIRASALWAPLVVHVPVDDPIAVIRIPTVLVEISARGVLPTAEPDVWMLRRTLIDPEGWRRHLPSWADLVWPDLPAPQRAVLHSLLADEQSPPLTKRRRPARSAAKRCLKAVGLGTYRKLSGILHVLETLQFLWADPARTVAEAAVISRFPYADETSFSNRCLQVTGYRPSDLKNLLSWEWLLWAIIRRHETGDDEKSGSR